MNILSHIWMRICIYILQTSMEDRIKNTSVLGDPIYISERFRITWSTLYKLGCRGVTFAKKNICVFQVELTFVHGFSWLGDMKSFKHLSTTTFYTIWGSLQKKIEKEKHGTNRIQHDFSTGDLGTCCRSSHESSMCNQSNICRKGRGTSCCTPPTVMDLNPPTVMHMNSNASSRYIPRCFYSVVLIRFESPSKGAWIVQ